MHRSQTLLVLKDQGIDAFEHVGMPSEDSTRLASGLSYGVRRALALEHLCDAGLELVVGFLVERLL